MTQTSPQISCQEMVERTTAYLEEQLSEAEARWTEEHLAGCPPCRAYIAQMRATIAALRSLAEPSLDPELRDRILGALA